MICLMKLVFWIFPSCAFILALSSCGSNSGNPGDPSVVTGPFDKNGNYVEEWADNPSKWRKSGGSASPHEQKSDELPEIAKNDQPPQNSVPLVTAPSPKPAPVIAKTEVKEPTSKPKTTEKKPEPVVVKAKPKPKPVVKAKPKSTRYVVKKGDSLSLIASRTGSSVTAIKSANGISGTIIQPGQSLIIPKK